MELFESKLQKYVRHSYTWKRQHVERTKACKGPTLLKKTNSFGSRDYVANEKLSTMIMPQGLDKSLAEVSKLVIYESSNNEKDTKTSAHVYISKQNRMDGTVLYLH